MIAEGYGVGWFVAALAGIRPQLNWAAFAVNNWPVHIWRTADFAQVEILTTLVYASGDSVGVSFNAEGASPLSVRDAAVKIGSFPEDKRQIVRGSEASYIKNGTARLTIPAYDLGEKGFLILDGNHRTIALSLARQPFQLDVLAIRGPIDPGIMPDLKHFV